MSEEELLPSVTLTRFIFQSGVAKQLEDNYGLLPAVLLGEVVGGVTSMVVDRRSALLS